jgi:hypothetical protein
MQEILICYFIDSGFGGVLGDLHETIHSFIWAILLARTSSLLKPNIFWRVPCLVKLLRTWKLAFNWLPRKKQFLDVCRQLMLRISSDYPNWGIMSTYVFCRVSRCPQISPNDSFFPVDEVCPVYRKTCLDRFEEHESLLSRVSKLQIQTWSCSGCSFFMLLSAHEYLWKKRRMWTSIGCQCKIILHGQSISIKLKKNKHKYLIKLTKSNLCYFFVK